MIAIKPSISSSNALANRTPLPCISIGVRTQAAAFSFSTLNALLRTFARAHRSVMMPRVDQPNTGSKKLTVRVPLRLDFAGGWTDVPDFAEKEGGAVVNAAIDRYVEGSAIWDRDGLKLEYRLDLPPDSHLGSSSAIDLAWLKLTFGLIGRDLPPPELAETVFALEGVLGEKGGKQDGYAAALGGLNLLRFGGADQSAVIEPIHLGPEQMDRLENQLLLCFSGPSEGSSDLHKQVWRRYREGDQTIIQALRTLKDTVEPTRAALLAEDHRTLGELLTQNREAARALGAGAVTQRMDTLFDAAEQAGALGGKPCGAGGGGFVLLLCQEGSAQTVTEALQSCGGPVLPVKFAPRV